MQHQPPTLPKFKPSPSSDGPSTHMCALASPLDRVPYTLEPLGTLNPSHVSFLNLGRVGVLNLGLRNHVKNPFVTPKTSS